MFVTVAVFGMREIEGTIYVTSCVLCMLFVTLSKVTLHYASTDDQLTQCKTGEFQALRGREELSLGCKIRPSELRQEERERVRRLGKKFIKRESPPV